MNIFKSVINRKHRFKRFSRLYSVGLVIAAFIFSQCAGDSNTFDEPPEAVSLLSATAGIGQVELSWTNPGSEFDQVTVFYKQGATVSGSDDPDAAETDAGTAESYLFTGLTNGKTYHFTVYTYKEEGGYSSAEAVSAVPKFPPALPDTGQTAGYTATFGEDNDYINVPNPRSYTDNYDDTVTDNVTKLMWEKLTNTADQSTDWDSAVTECENRTTANYNDWRLPNVHELSSLLNYGNENPSINTAYFPNTVSYFYWSSTGEANNSGKVWQVYFRSGAVVPDEKFRMHYFRCVRGDQISSGVNLTDNGDGTVTDTDTGLVWQQLEANHTAKNWEAALTYCENLFHANRSEWRLPSINELRSLIDYNAFSPAINTATLPNTKSSLYWSSTTYTGGSAHASTVNFDSGFLEAANKTSDNYVRCVSGG